MPIQTTKTEDVHFPDGCKVEISTDSGGSYDDLGAISSACTATLEYDVNEVNLANAIIQKQTKNMRVSGGFTLVNLNIDRIADLSGGMLTVTDTAGSPLATIPDQVLASGQTEKALINLAPETSSSDTTKIKFSTTPVLTSVTGSVDGALVADDDYTIHPDSNSFSGYSISFNLAGTALTTMTQTFTIDYGTNTPVASSTLKGGESSQVLTAYLLRFTHTDENSETRILNLYSVDIESGGLQFNYKGANEDGVEEMPITFMARIDPDRTSGEQLMDWTVTSGY